MSRVLVLAVHPESVAATRVRAMQYSEHFAKRELDLRLWSFLREDDLIRWFGRSQLGRVGAVLRGMLRLPTALIELLRADVVIVQREALPLGPPLLEWLSSRLRPTVWDVDDAIWTDYTSPTAGRIPRWIRATGDKYRRICGWSTEVWPGSEVLATWCRRHNDNVHVIPSVVSVPEALPEPDNAQGLTWIGSHSTAVFLDGLLAALARAQIRQHINIVGGEPLVPDGLDVRVMAWSSEVEERVLRDSRVGLYPIDRDHPLAEGKCGFKAILYMSRGIPPVVTPTTTNAAVVRDGVDGFHANSPDEWSRRITQLLTDAELWSRMSASSHERARAEYSLEVWGPRVAARLVHLRATQTPSRSG